MNVERKTVKQREAAKILGVSRPTIIAMERRGAITRLANMGRCARYNLKDVLALAEPPKEEPAK